MRSALTEILQGLGGDPRDRFSDQDDVYMTEMESKARAMTRARERPTSTTGSGASASSAVTLPPIMPTLSPSKSSTALLSEQTVPANNTTTATVPLRSLTSEEAIELLIIFGCHHIIRERVIELGLEEEVNGEYLANINRIEILQELENNKQVTREPKLAVVLEKLKKAAKDGVLVNSDYVKETVKGIRESLARRKEQQRHGTSVAAPSSPTAPSAKTDDTVRDATYTISSITS